MHVLIEHARVARVCVVTPSAQLLQRRTSSPSAYVNCVSFFSTEARSTVSPARHVFSTVLLVMKFFSLLRTNAAPFPGLTCKNSAAWWVGPGVYRTPPPPSIPRALTHDFVGRPVHFNGHAVSEVVGRHLGGEHGEASPACVCRETPYAGERPRGAARSQRSAQGVGQVHGESGGWQAQRTRVGAEKRLRRQAAQEASLGLYLARTAGACCVRRGGQNELTLSRGPLRK